MKLIDKDVLVAEIKRLLKCDKLYKSADVETRNSILEFILSFLNTLEVKEVDFGIEFYRYIGGYFNVYDDGNQTLQTKDKKSLIGRYDAEKIAKHFFELGLNSRHKS